MSGTTESTVLVVGAAGNFEDLVELLSAAGDPLRVEAVTDDQLSRVADDDVGAVVACDAPPETDGLALYSAVVEQDATVPVLLVGADKTPERVETALRNGVTEYVVWDGDAGILAAKLRAVLASPQSGDAAAAARRAAVVGALTHDAKNPLNVVSGRLELLDIEDVHSEAMTRSVDRVSALLDDLSVLARLDRPVTSVGPVSLGDVATEVWENVGHADAELAIATDLTLQTDEDRVVVILERVLENAAVHGGEDVTVTVGETDDGFYVADDGPGIDPDERETVFEQGYSTGKYDEGYGLFVVQCAVRSLGWSLTVTESDSGGARFEFATGGHPLLADG